MFYETIKEYKPVRLKPYTIFLEKKINNMVVACCVHDNEYCPSFTRRFMDYNKQEILYKLKLEIKQMEGGQDEETRQVC